MKILIAALSLFSLSAHAGYIVDTGQSAPRFDAYAFTDWQYFGAQFTLTSAYRINSVETVAQSDRPAHVLYTISADANNRPGTTLLSGSSMFSASNTFTWVGAYDMKFELLPGTYWVTFQPTDNIGAAISGRASIPLPEYMQGMYGMWYNVPVNNYDSLNLEIRIGGEQLRSSEMPEPSTALLVALAALALGQSVRRPARPPGHGGNPSDLKQEGQQ